MSVANGVMCSIFLLSVAVLRMCSGADAPLPSGPGRQPRAKCFYPVGVSRSGFAGIGRDSALRCPAPRSSGAMDVENSYLVKVRSAPATARRRRSAPSLPLRSRTPGHGASVVLTCLVCLYRAQGRLSCSRTASAGIESLVQASKRNSLGTKWLSLGSESQTKGSKMLSSGSETHSSGFVWQ